MNLDDKDQNKDKDQNQDQNDNGSIVNSSDRDFIDTSFPSPLAGSGPDI